MLRVAALLAAVALLGGCAGDEDDRGGKPARPPVVVLVLDEFPTDALLTPGGEIDRERFPNFAALARTSTWFPNAFTVYDSTFKAVPSILDGIMPMAGTAADQRSHQPNAFHLVHKHGYGVVDVESASALCPDIICPGSRIRRPGVLARLAGSGRPARLHRWIGAIRRRQRPFFYFQHALLPHEPWIYLPSGRQSRPAGVEPILPVNKVPGFENPTLTDHNHLRHLLQVGYTDRLVGELLARLQRTGLLERALIVVTADHGYSFQVGVSSRRLLSERNVEEIAPVPLFVKAPGQMDGRVDESLASNLDLVATVADLLGTRVSYRQDGRSAFSEEVKRRTGIAVRTRDFARVVRIGLPELKARRAGWRRRWAKLFGTGAQSELLYGDPWALAYRIGPHKELLDRRLAPAGAAPPSLTAEADNPSLYAHVSTHARLLPTRVTGRLDGVPVGRHYNLALAVNGRVRAVGRSFDLTQKQLEFFSFLVPESALREGANQLELFQVRPGGALARIAGL